MRKAAFAVLAILAATTQAQTCASLQECGEQVDFPEYYTYGMNSTGMINMFKIAVVNLLLFGSYFYKANYRAYVAFNGSAPALGWLGRDHYTAKLTAAEQMTVANFALFGLGALLYIAAGVIPGLSGLTAFFVAHVLSNLSLPVYGFTLYTLVTADFGIGYALLYAVYAIYSYQSESSNGVALLRQLNPDYPYLDASLQPSILYLLGLATHVEAYPYQSVDLEEVDKEEISEEIVTM